MPLELPEDFEEDPAILFLDVDGVLNCCGRSGQGLMSDKVELLSEIVLSTGCELVISSTWRNYEEPRMRLMRMASDHSYI